MSYSRTLHFYILVETLKVFVLSVVAVTVVMNFGAVLVYLNRFPLPLPSLMKVLLYRMPALFPWTFPLALLVAVTLTYGRMSTDNEIMAMQASGMHMGWVMLPGLLLGLCVSGGLYVVNDRVQPYCERREYEVFEEEAPSVLRMLLMNPDRFRQYLDEDMPYTMTWKRSEGSRLHDLEVTQRDAQNRVVLSYQAEWADFTIEEAKDGETGLLTRDLVLRQHNVRGTRYPTTSFRIEKQDKRIPITGMFRREPGNKSMTTTQLRKKIQDAREKARARGEGLLQQLAEGGSPEHIQQVNLEMEQNQRALEETVNPALTRIFSRMSLSGAALAFVMVGIPLGILSRRSHMLSAFFLASLPVLIVYWPLWLLGQALAESRSIEEVSMIALMVWMPTLVMLVAGTILTLCLMRR